MTMTKQQLLVDLTAKCIVVDELNIPAPTNQMYNGVNVATYVVNCGFLSNSGDPTRGKGLYTCNVQFYVVNDGEPGESAYYSCWSPVEILGSV